MSKDRARPFSRKHRRYWITITGGMLLIGALNVGIGVCSYEPPGPDPERIILTLPPPTRAALPVGHVTLGELPAAVMRAFADQFPRHVPSAARQLTTPGQPVAYELSFGTGDALRRVTFREDGTFVGEAPARAVAPAP